MNHNLNFTITLEDIQNKLSPDDREKYKYIKFTEATAYDKQVHISCLLLEEPIKSDDKAYRLSSIPNDWLSIN